MNAHAGGDPREPKRTPAMAWLAHPIEKENSFRMVCLGCSEKLHKLGMIEIIKEMPFSERQPEYSAICYAIAPGFTLADCQAAVPEHVGPPAWGE